MRQYLSYKRGSVNFTEDLKNRIINGYRISREEALILSSEPVNEITAAANELRIYFCGKKPELCSIINGRSGRCSEDCRFCAQSAHYKSTPEEYPLEKNERFVKEALYNYKKGINRFSIVTSGRKLTESEIKTVCEIYSDVKKNTGISLCASHGLLSTQDFSRLKKAGVTRYHCNLETSRRFFPDICSTHTYDDKINVIRNAQAAKLEICSGGIIGLDETMEDRIDMAMDISSFEIKSVPVNVLNPIKGTPLENQPFLSEEEILRTLAVFRFILPDAAIRLAGGRALMNDMGSAGFISGANAAITGDMLTTAGISINEDLTMLSELGYENSING